jgi:hypothetical protein
LQIPKGDFFASGSDQMFSIESNLHVGKGFDLERFHLLVTLQIPDSNGDIRTRNAKQNSKKKIGIERKEKEE